MAPTASGYQYSHPNPGEEVCVTGIAGYFPKSNSIAEFRDNLFAKLDLIDDPKETWTDRDVNWSSRLGKINKRNKFDAEFFGMNFNEAHHIDPMSRLLLERTYEAIIDAGMNPAEFRNSKTSVFIATCFVDTDKGLMANRLEINEHAIIGCSRSNLAVRISEWLGLKGPNYMSDTACSGSMYIMDRAYRAIRDGRCDAAIVGSGNLCICHAVVQQGRSLGLTAPDGKCKCFDESCDGYVRSEAVVVCLLQKTKDARRVHAQLIHVKTNCDGFKQQSIIFPSADMQAELLRDVYEECAISPDTLEYVECHSTGTFAGDREELIALDEVICKRRSKPLLIGSVKSNMGHSEPVSGLCSLAKVCIAYNSDFIAPNINLVKLRKEIPCIAEGRVQVVTEQLPCSRGYVAINNFGFGGGNAHCLLRNTAKQKVNNGLPNDNLPRAVCVSGRTRSAVARILRHLQSNSLDAEEIRLWHAIHAKDIPGHNYRGYIILNSFCSKTVSLGEEIEKTSGVHYKTFFYSHIDKQCINSFLGLMEIPSIGATIQRCQKALASKGLNLIKLFKEYDSTKENITDVIIIVAIHIIITDLLKEANITADFIIGEGLGELCCAYADGCLTDAETLLAAYTFTEKYSTEINSNFIINGNNHNSLHHKADTTHCHLTSHTADRNIISIIDHEVYTFLNERVPIKYRSKRWLPNNKQYEESENNNLIITNIPNKLLNQTDSNTVIVGVTSQNNINKNMQYVPLFHDSGDNVVYFIRSFCRLFMLGLNPDISHLYPSVHFPVSQGTSFLSHLVEWRHQENWCVDFPVKNNLEIIERKVTIALEEATEYLRGHCVNGRVLYPGTGYLVLAWETLALTYDLAYDNLSVVFEDVRWQRATVIPEKGGIEFLVTLHKITGEFEITENDVVVTTGRIYAKKNVGEHFEEMLIAPNDDSDDIRMTTKDFYKEIELRGYGHKDLFQGILDINLMGTHSRIAWINNWVVFLDSLFQTHLFSKRTRNLYVPTRLEKLSLDTDLHFANIKKDSVHYIEALCDNTTNVIRSPGIEIRGLYFDVIAKNIEYNLPQLERYLFVPYFEKQKNTIEAALQVFIQIVLENNNIFMFKCVEIFDNKIKSEFGKPIIRIIEEVIRRTPRIEHELSIVTDTPLEMLSHINVVSNGKELEDETTVLVVAANILTNVEPVEKYRPYLLRNGFIISREKVLSEIKCDKFELIAVQNVDTEKLVLLKSKSTTKTEKCYEIEAKDDEFLWVDKIKSEDMGKNKVILYSQNKFMSGLIGLVKCLRREPDGGMVSAFLILDPTAPPFDIALEFYREQIHKNLVINVFQDGQWGSYRHLFINEGDAIKPVPHAYVNLGNIGDVSSLQWYEGPFTDDVTSNVNLIHVYSSAMNFRDVLIATGRMHVDIEFVDALKKDCLLGIEAAGRTANGSRVMCFTHKGFSNKVLCGDDFLLPVPDEWTFEEAASIMVAYATVYVGFIMMGKMQAGESVLIHAGAGGVGQAAINVALHHNCEVFTTVGSPEKRALLMKLYPQLKDSHIGSSRDKSFENMIRKETNGRGVDLVMNSLAEDMLLTSIRCLANRGRFLEIGKYDIARNTLVDASLQNQEFSYHSIMLDHLDRYSTQTRNKLLELMVIGVASGAVRPLTSCTFDKNCIESAFRYMASGKHTGKVVIKIREDEIENKVVKPTPLLINASPRYVFNPEKVFVIVGGLGGFGLELADWLVLRRAKKLVLVSSRGITNGYQKYRIRVWKSYGVHIEVCTHDVTTEAGCEEMLKLANSLGAVEGIFNLAVVLKDALFKTQTRDSFKSVYKPKANVAMNLDKLSRTMCPELKTFVMFSSIACGQGNAGQTNYGLANSVMESICNQRKSESLPGLAIQWGLIGDVGIVADMIRNKHHVDLKGISTQSIASCLDTLDKLLKQEDAAVVSSYVITEKTTSIQNKLSLVETIAKIKGIRDLKAISHQATLIELGMDSMMAVEVKQALERNFKIFLTPQEIRKLTFARLTALSNKNEEEELTGREPMVTKPLERKDNQNFFTFIKNVGNEECASKPFIYIPDVQTENKTDPSHSILFVVPGFEGSAVSVEKLCLNLPINTCVLQLGVYNSTETLEQITNRIFEILSKILPPEKPFKLLGYSFGTSIVLGLAAKLEKQGRTGQVFCLDGSPHYLHQALLSIFKDDTMLRDYIITSVFHLIDVDGNAEEFNGQEDILSEVDLILDKYDAIPKKYSKKFIKALAVSALNRYKIMLNTKNCNLEQIKSPIILIRSKNSFGISVNDKYGLDECTDGNVTVHYVMSDHSKVPDDENCASILRKYLTNNYTT